MSKKNAYVRMVPEIVKYMNRYADEILHVDTAPLQEKAEKVYETIYAETPDIGGGDNPMADNLYGFITFCAYYEASDHRIGTDSVPYLSSWRCEDKKAAGKLVDLNKKSSVWLFKVVFKKIVKMTVKKKAKGEWGNTWSMAYNPDGRTEGMAYTLYGCPLLAFAKAHGYEEMMPAFCLIDHSSAELMHGKLIRFETEATGGKCCDYWFVGDHSEAAKKYADLPKK